MRLARLALFLRPLVHELAEVEQATDGRDRVRRNLHQIHVLGFGHVQRIARGHDAKLLPVHIDQAHLAYADGLVHSLVFIANTLTCLASNNTLAREC